MVQPDHAPHTPTEGVTRYRRPSTAWDPRGLPDPGEASFTVLQGSEL